jgi:hypothetical protein
MASSGREEMDGDHLADEPPFSRVGGELDAPPLPVRHLQAAIALQLMQRGAQCVTAHLQTGAQLALSRQMAMPVPACMDSRRLCAVWVTKETRCGSRGAVERLFFIWCAERTRSMTLWQIVSITSFLMSQNARILSHSDLLQLKRWNTPTIYNGWEQITKHNPGADAFNIEETRDFMPQMGPMVGYAVTLVIEPGNASHRQTNPGGRGGVSPLHRQDSRPEDHRRPGSRQAARPRLRLGRSQCQHVPRPRLRRHHHRRRDPRSR